MYCSLSPLRSMGLSISERTNFSLTDLSKNQALLLTQNLTIIIILNSIGTYLKHETTCHGNSISAVDGLSTYSCWQSLKFQMGL